MKIFCYFLFSFLVSLNLYGQNCQRLDAQSFFKSIQYGEKIPPDLAVCTNKSNNGNATNISFLRIEFDSLQQACRKKYADLFIFHSESFSFSQISTNQKGQVLSVEYYSFFDEYKATASTSDNPLPRFEKLYKKLETLYGKPTMLELPTRTDSLLMKEKGMEQAAIWSCNNIDLKLRVYHGAPQKGLNVLHVIIRNRDFDKPEVLRSLQ